MALLLNQRWYSGLDIHYASQKVRLTLNNYILSALVRNPDAHLNKYLNFQFSTTPSQIEPQVGQI